jgi:hypothetical protein
VARRGQGRGGASAAWATAREEASDVGRKRRRKEEIDADGLNRLFLADVSVDVKSKELFSAATDTAAE